MAGSVHSSHPALSYLSPSGSTDSFTLGPFFPTDQQQQQPSPDRSLFQPTTSRSPGRILHIPAAPSLLLPLPPPPLPHPLPPFERALSHE